MKVWRWAGSLLVVAGCLLSTSCFNSDEDVTLQGAGATFPAALQALVSRILPASSRRPYELSADRQRRGLRQFNDGLLNFAASDAYEEPKVDGGVYLIPMTAGGVAICYNVPGGPENLKLSRAVYVDIFLGKITDWDDARIVADNSGFKMPSLPIWVVRRSEGSGTTFAFTNHLNAISPAGKRKTAGPAEANRSFGRPDSAGTATPASPPPSSRPRAQSGIWSSATPSWRKSQWRSCKTRPASSSRPDPGERPGCPERAQ